MAAIAQVDAYRAYLRSPDWQRRRTLKLNEVGWRCQGCGEQERLEVHHLVYDRVGRERPEDLQVLCHWCHASEHRRSPRDMPVAPVLQCVDGDLLLKQRAAASRMALNQQLDELIAGIEDCFAELADYRVRKRLRGAIRQLNAARPIGTAAL